MKNDLFEEHLQQQLIVEQWSQNRGVDLEVPDFTDYVFRDKEVVEDYHELDCFYQSWNDFMK